MNINPISSTVHTPVNIVSPILPVHNLIPTSLTSGIINSTNSIINVYLPAHPNPDPLVIPSSHIGETIHPIIHIHPPIAHNTVRCLRKTNRKLKKILNIRAYSLSSLSSRSSSVKSSQSSPTLPYTRPSSCHPPTFLNPFLLSLFHLLPTLPFLQPYRFTLPLPSPPLPLRNFLHPL